MKESKLPKRHECVTCKKQYRYLAWCYKHREKTGHKKFRNIEKFDAFDDYSKSGD